MKIKFVSFASFTLIILLTLSFSAFSQDSKMLVSTDWLAKNIDSVALLHIGPDTKRYNVGHIPGSRFVAWKEIATIRDGVPNELPRIEVLTKLFKDLGIGNTKKIVIYGDVRGLYAARTFFTLDYLGHGNRVALLNGGLEKWKGENRTVSVKVEERIPANFIPNVQLGKVVPIERVIDVSWSIQNLKRPKFSLVDARPIDYYAGVKKSKSNKRGGHIPGAKSFYWMNNLVSRDNPVMLPKGKLRKMYESQGVTRSKKAIVYCQSGGQASHTYFTLRYLGYDVTMYDGSFGEWSNKEFTVVYSRDGINTIGH